MQDYIAAFLLTHTANSQTGTKAAFLLTHRQRVSQARVLPSRAPIAHLSSGCSRHARFIDEAFYSQTGDARTLLLGACAAGTGTDSRPQTQRLHMCPVT